MLRNVRLTFTVTMSLFVVVFCSARAKAQDMPIFEDAGVKFGDATWWLTLAVAIGDVDNDGDLDVGLGNHCHYDSIYMNLGENQFTMGSYPIGGWGNPYEAVFADMDGDGDLDFLTGSSKPLDTGPIVISVNRGDGTFFAGPWLPLCRLQAYVVGDFTGDGLPDVAAERVLFVNEGELSFRQVSTDVMCVDYPRSMAAADVDGDGDMDIASWYGIWFNDGTGNFTLSDNLLVVPASRYWLYGQTFADFNGDESPDVAVCTYRQFQAEPYRQLVFFNDGTGNFQLVQELGREVVVSYAAADFDNDGWVDLVTAGGPYGVKVYLNDGTGIMIGPVQVLEMGSNEVAAGDMDNDGWVDLVVPQQRYDRTNHLWLNVLGKYDTTPPETFIDDPDPSVLWPPDHKFVSVNVTGSVVDRGSGVEAAWIRVDDEYDQLDNVHDITDLLDENGAFETAIDLIAWRNGEDLDGRKYRIILYAVDKAGNESELQAAIAWVPHDERK